VAVAADRRLRAVAVAADRRLRAVAVAADRRLRAVAAAADRAALADRPAPDPKVRAPPWIWEITHDLHARFPISDPPPSAWDLVQVISGTRRSQTT
jgi:hypothetical protein